MDVVNECYELIRGNIAGLISENFTLDDKGIYEYIDREIENLENKDLLSIKNKLELRKKLFFSYRRLGVLDELLCNKNISEIMVNGCKHIFVEEGGETKELDIEFESKEQLEDIIQQIVARVNRIVNASSPIVDARLEDGSRVHVVLAPVAINGPIITIRKFPEPITMEKLIRYGAVSEEVSTFLAKLVRAGYNIFISGGTNSGKTTFLNALSEFIPGSERVITIEDSAELNLSHIKNLVSLETKNSNTGGEGAISMSDLIRAALRMNPDRIVVGEVRGKEALDMLQAMNTGHDGSLSTGHANSPIDMLSRLETMVLSGANLPLPAVRAQISGALDVIVHLGRLRDNKRRVLSVIEIGEYLDNRIETRVLYEFEEDEKSTEKELFGSLVKRQEIKFKRKLEQAGIRL